MLAAKNSRKRMPARSPAAATSAGRVGDARRTGVRLELDTRVFLDLLFHEALRKVLEEIDSEGAGSFCAFLGFIPHLGTAHRIQKVVSVPAQATKSHALHWLCSETLDKAGLL